MSLRIFRRVSYSFFILIFAVLIITNVEPFKAQTEDEKNPGVPEYTIGIEDVLSIFVWKEEVLSRTVIVRPDGRISFPLVSDIAAEGLTCRQLAESIKGKLLFYIKDPNVTVIIDEVNSFKAYVLGAVNKQGVFTLKRPTRLMEVLSMAEGLNEFANKSNILILRRERDKEIRIQSDYRKIISGEKPEDNIFIKPGDTIIAK